MSTRIKTAFGIFTAAALGIAAALVASAASGDGIWLTKTAATPLPAGTNRTALIAAAADSYPGFAIADLESYGCRRHKKIPGAPGVVVLGSWKCRARKRADQLTAAQELDQLLSGVYSDGVAQTLKAVPMKSAALHGTFTAGFFGKNLDELGAFECRRTGSVPECDSVEITTGTPDEWRTARLAGGVVGTIGRVQ